MSDAYIGEINIFPYNFIPRNYMACAGQVLPISQYSALYSVIGTTYGGDGRVSFALPDLRGRVPIGYGAGPGLTPRTIGSKLGAEEVVVTTEQLPSHKHDVCATRSAATQTIPTGAAPANGARKIYADPTNVVAMNASSLENEGGNQAHENMSPSMPLQFCICVNGIYPTRS